ncbi:MAG: hypothetical protein K6A40_09115 [Solobacterium sp.]|nr:hypothetical protein [Solobacterium sp.]
MTPEEYNHKIEELEKAALNREITFCQFSKENWLEEFRSFFRIREKMKTVPEDSEFSYEERMNAFTGEVDTALIMSLADELFGRPSALYQIHDDSKLKEWLGGRRGGSGFYIVFDLFFAVYDTCTVCWISGTNN